MWLILGERGQQTKFAASVRSVILSAGTECTTDTILIATYLAISNYSPFEDMHILHRILLCCCEPAMLQGAYVQTACNNTYFVTNSS